MGNYLRIFLITVAVVVSVIGYNKTVTYIESVRTGASQDGRNSVTPVIKVERVPYEVTTTIYKTKVDSVIVPVYIEGVKDTEFVYFAAADTILQDDSVHFRARYYSPVPLSPDGYFKLWYNYECPETTKTITEFVQEKSSRFGLGITFSGGYGFYRQKPDVHIGLGLYYKIDF